MAEIPQKNSYRIGEVCQYTETQAYVLRFWESEFPQLTPEKSPRGQRIYRRRDIELILRIKTLLYDEEYTIAGARKRLTVESKQRRAGKAGAELSKPAARTRARNAAAPRRIEPNVDVVSQPTSGSVDRERYENAVHEIQRLRRELEQREEERDEQGARAQELEQVCAEQRHRAASALERLETLFETLTGKPAPR